MTRAQVQYINKNLKLLANYINHLVKFNRKYNDGISELCLKCESGSITKSEETIEYEKEIKASYDKAIELYNDLKRIAQNYKFGTNVEYEIQWFHNRLIAARLPIYEKATLRLTTSEQDGVPTGGAAEINDLSYTDDETLQEETSTVLQGGVRYCRYINQTEDFQEYDDVCNESDEDNTNFYSENKEDENQGYTGDSIELAAEYKKKYDEEQKKKAEQLAKQNTANQSAQNWILPVSKGHKITSRFGKRIPPAPGASNFHDGIDINTTMNTPVYAVANGTVVVAGWIRGYGNYIEINHGNNIHSFYGHLNKIYVTKGKYVEQGQNVGLSGNTGVGTGAHLHFGVHINGDKKDPTIYLPNF